MEKLNLCGKWSFCQVDGGETLDASVPGCNFTDLLAAGKIPQPFYGVNEKSLYWVGEKDWKYFRNFSITAAQLAGKSARLVFECLDTVADVSLNGQKILHAENCHIEHSVEVGQLLEEGSNTLEVHFYSPVNYVLKKQAAEKCPRNSNGLTGIPHIRKPQYHFGWDWGPVLTPSGISGKVYLEFPHAGRLYKNAAIRQTHSSNSVQVNIKGGFENLTDKPLKVLSTISLEGELLHSAEQTTGDEYDFNFQVENPRLWQTAEWSNGQRQPLYKIDISLWADGAEVDRLTRKIGLRTIELDRSNDEFGQNFRFILNGRPLFAKGANWIPADSFINRVSRQKTEQYIKRAADANFNMLRVWGGGFYGNDDFYDLCDEYGILVWQDFMYACQPYPFFDAEFLNNVKAETEYIVQKLRHRASLCLWCGNNEIEAMSVAWLNRKKYVEWTEKFFYHILPQIVDKMDGVTPYIAGTPVGSAHNKDVGSDNVGDTHLWAVWHGLQDVKYYRKRQTRFCSEFGFESLPSKNCLKSFAAENEFSLDSEVFNAHQKCADGNLKMLYYISKRFAIPKSFDDLIYLSQICQEESIRDATEHWRRNKGRCNGSLYWQYNDCWPVCSWSSIDYQGGYKALQYGAKNFFAPVTLSLEDSKKSVKVFAVNDLLQPFSGKVNVRLLTFFGEVIFSRYFDAELAENSVQAVTSFGKNDYKKYADKAFLVAELTNEKGIVSRRTLLFKAEKKLDLPEAEIAVSVSLENEIATYTLQSKTFARSVFIDTPFNEPLSNNFFDLLPDEKVVITQSADSGITQKQLQSLLTVRCANRIQRAQSALKDTALRCITLLKPINFGGYIYYKFMV